MLFSLILSVKMISNFFSLLLIFFLVPPGAATRPSTLDSSVPSGGVRRVRGSFLLSGIFLVVQHNFAGGTEVPVLIAMYPTIIKSAGLRRSRSCRGPFSLGGEVLLKLCYLSAAQERIHPLVLQQEQWRRWLSPGHWSHRGKKCWR